MHAIELAAEALRTEVSRAAVRDNAVIQAAISAIVSKTDQGLVVLPGPINNTHRQKIIDLTARRRLPAIYPFKYYAQDGGLVYYGINQVNQWPKAAEYVIAS